MAFAGVSGVVPVVHASGISSLPGVGVMITDSGPLNDIIVGLDGTMQVQDQDFSPTAQCTTAQNCGEVFPTDSLTASCSADAGPWVAIGNTEYGPNMSDTTIHCEGTATGALRPDVTYTPVSQTTSGTGTSGDPYTIVTTLQLTSSLNLVETMSYAVGSETIDQSFELVSTGSPVTANIFFGADIYLALTDQGFSYYQAKTGDPNSNGVNFQIGGLNAIDTTTMMPVTNCSAPPPDSVGPGTFHEFFAPDAAANHFVEDFYNSVWSDIDNAIHNTTPTHLPDTALQPPFQASNQCLDNAAAVEWDGVGSGTTIRQNFAFGTTSSSPAYVQGFSAKRHGSAVTFRWRTVLPRILAGFYLYAGSHRLDRRIVPVHAKPTYVQRLHWRGRGAYSLHVVLRSGSQIVVSAG
jgi:hypothetical protein